MRAGPGQTVAARYEVTDRAPQDGTAGPRRLATDLRSGVPVLLEALELPEVLVPELAGSADFEASRWLDPAEVLAAVRAVLARTPEHARLRQVFEVLAEDGLVWVVGEQPVAVELSELLQEGPLEPYRAAELAADLVSGLGAVHRAGLAHGQVVAEQVLICADGAALLGGQAGAAAEEALARGLSGTDGRRWAQARAGLVGTRAERWSPELLRPELLGQGAAAGPEADLWALGVLLQRVLTGQGPFPEATPTALFAAVRAGQRSTSGGCGPLAPLVDRLLAADPAERPTAEEAGRWLAELLAHAPEPLQAVEPAQALPVPRPAWPLVPRPRHRGAPSAEAGGQSAAQVAPEPARHAHAAARRPSRLLPVVLVGGVLAAMVLGIAAVVVFAG
ncbi:protein kinase [Kitasatospora sp. NPDC008050]|uniref:protein kinase domain-containing protein n=1 Tax=Kitasatospora sp. NPDC008050 TaxID=3364021 RepID=UPI0036EC226C